MTMLEVSDGRPPAQVVWHTSVRLLREARELLGAALDTSSPTTQTPPADRRLTTSSQRPPPPPPVLPLSRPGAILNGKPSVSHHDQYPIHAGDTSSNNRLNKTIIDYGVRRTDSPGPITDPVLAARDPLSNRPFSEPNPLAHAPANIPVREERMSQPPQPRLQHGPAHNTMGQIHSHEGPSNYGPSSSSINQANDVNLGFPPPKSVTAGSSWLPLTQSSGVDATMSPWPAASPLQMFGFAPRIDTSGANHSSNIMNFSPDVDMSTGQQKVSSPVSPQEGYFQRPSPGLDPQGSGISFNRLEEFNTPNRDLRNGFALQQEREQNTKTAPPFLSLHDALDFRKRRKKDSILSKSLSLGHRERISDYSLQDRLKDRDHVRRPSRDNFLILNGS